MFQRLGIGILVTSCLLLAPTLASAQAIGGTVTDSTGGVLPGVTIEVRSPALIEQVRTAVSDGAGEYLIIALEPGTYSASFVLPGFRTFVPRRGRAGWRGHGDGRRPAAGRVCRRDNHRVRGRAAGGHSRTWRSRRS